jgi:hypothetical protein
MTSRSQITLEPELRRLASTKAKREGVSFAEYVRRVIAKDVGKARPKADISEIFDLDKSAEPTNIARDKDRMLAEAIEFDLRRK